MGLQLPVDLVEPERERAGAAKTATSARLTLKCALACEVNCQWDRQELSDLNRFPIYFYTKYSN